MASYGKLLEEDIKNSMVDKITRHLKGELPLPFIKTRKFYIDEKIRFTEEEEREGISLSHISLDRIKFATSPVTNFDIVFLFSGAGIVEIDLLKDIYTEITGQYTIDNVTFVDDAPRLVDSVKEEMKNLNIIFQEVTLSSLNTENINDHTIVIAINPQISYFGKDIQDLEKKAMDKKQIKNIINKTNIFVVFQNAMGENSRERLVNREDQIFERDISKWPSVGGKYLRKRNTKRSRNTKRKRSKRKLYTRK